MLAPGRRPSTVGPGSHFLALNLILLQDCSQTTLSSGSLREVEAEVENQIATHQGHVRFATASRKTYRPATLATKKP